MDYIPLALHIYSNFYGIQGIIDDTLQTLQNLLYSLKSVDFCNCRQLYYWMIYFNLWSLEYLGHVCWCFTLTPGVKPSVLGHSIYLSGRALLWFQKKKQKKQKTLRRLPNSSNSVGFKILDFVCFLVGMARICSTFCLVSFVFWRHFAVHPTYAQFESLEGLRGFIFRLWGSLLRGSLCPRVSTINIQPLSHATLLLSISPVRPRLSSWLPAAFILPEAFTRLLPSAFKSLKNYFRVYNCFIKSKASTVQATPLLSTLKPTDSILFGEY